jgi:hypothetical protein
VVAVTGPGELELTVRSAGALRRGVDSDLTASSLRVVVTSWRTPYRGWTGRLEPLPGLVDHSVRLPERGRGEAVVTLSLAEPVPLRRIIAATRPALEPVHATVGTPARRAVTVDAPAGPAVEVDATAANPKGRERYGGRLVAGRLVLSGDGASWEVVRSSDSVTVVAGRTGEPLDDRQAAALARVDVASYHRCGAAPDRHGEAVGGSPGGAASGAQGSVEVPPAARAWVLAQLAMTGLVLHDPDPPVELAAELACLLRAPLPGPDADPAAWELRSVRQRRAAMRHHAVGLAARPPPVSALLLTRRPELVAPVVEAMAAQTYPELEIAVGVHGGELPRHLRGRLTGPVVSVPAERNLGQALAELTRAAGGQIVTKVDDDDRYGPEHVWDVVLARHYSGATVAGKGADFVHVEPRDLTVRRGMAAELYTDTVAGGTLTLARADLAAIGGWPPVPRWVDRALLDRVLVAGGLVYRTHPLGFVYTRHGDGHTWQADHDHFLVDPQRTWRGFPPGEEIGW